MAEIRDWLDTQKIVPDLFRHSVMEGVLTFHVTFSAANEATAFAVAFDGRIVNDTTDVAV